MKAKIIGLLFIALAIILFKAFPEDDMTGAVFFLMLGIPLLTCRE